MSANELPKRVVYLELIDSLMDADGGESRARFYLAWDFPWLFEEEWQIERWGLRRSRPEQSRTEVGSVRGLTFPLPVFPRVLLPVVVWATHFLQSMLRPRAGILLAYSPVMGTGAAAARFLRRKSPRLVVRITSDFWSSRARVLGGRRVEPRIVQALERFVLMQADLVLTVGPFTHNIVRQLGVPEERILELPRPTSWHGTEVASIDQDGPPRVAVAGRLVMDKAFDVLLLGFAEIAEEFPDLVLDMAGEGPERSNLQGLAASLRIADRVRFRGWLDGDSMRSFFSGALISVLPSPLNEGLPAALLEAGLAGCALIGTDVGGVRDIVHPDRTGILIPPNDPGALADALRTLLRDPQQARRLGEGARALARAHLARRDDALQRVRERMNALRAGSR
jgi:glycosyltransferase involved in cell wall biosynthesis